MLLVLAPRHGQKRSQLLAQLAAAAAIALIVINASYLFRHERLIMVDTEWLARTESIDAIPLLAIVHWLSPLFPPYFIVGILAMLARDAGDHHLF